MRDIATIPKDLKQKVELAQASPSLLRKIYVLIRGKLLQMVEEAHHVVPVAPVAMKVWLAVEPAVPFCYQSTILPMQLI